MEGGSAGGTLSAPGPMNYFPIFMDVRARPCLVVGGGEAAARKAALLLRAGARVSVVASELTAEMRALLENAALRHSAREFRPVDLEGVVLVVAASGDDALDARVSADARDRQLPVNVVDRPEQCNFIVPALIERGSLVVAVGTGGGAPVLARLVRGHVEAALPQRYGELVELCARLRSEVRDQLPEVQRRRRFWEESLEGEPAELVFQGEPAAAETALRGALRRAAAQRSQPIAGEVYLVGAGPNDPELISFRAQRLMQRAELVLHADDVAAAIVELSRRDAQRVAFSPPLERAAALLLPRMAAAVRAGHRVCVLARGDAFRDPMGRRFADRVGELNVAAQVVPGIAERDCVD